MAGDMKMRAALNGDVAEVKVLMSHPMESGLRKDAKTDKMIPAHYINMVVATLNGKDVIESQWGSAISKNPFLGFKVKGVKAGDKIAVHAVDNMGTKFDGEVAVA
ncbi:MAG TPA: thiosulfate oxidation carrier complex protein SoxZ [Gallionellaceae bacterium]|nr:thiosulfate oxidation carrier complex protein SoxZ [Gallionellaceae bacterium]